MGIWRYSHPKACSSFAMDSSVSSSIPAPLSPSVLVTQILHASMLMKVMVDVLMTISPNVCSVSLRKVGVPVMLARVIAGGSIA